MRVQISSAPPGTTHHPHPPAASSARNLPANDAQWPPPHSTSPVLLVEGGLRRRQDDHQAFLDRGDDPGGRFRGGVAVMGPDGAGLMQAGPPAGLVAHQLVDDPGRDAGVLQPGREGMAEVMGAVQVDRLQQGMLGGWLEGPSLRLRIDGGGTGRGELGQGAVDGGPRGGAGRWSTPRWSPARRPRRPAIRSRS
jgi:hypothetical protein